MSGAIRHALTRRTALTCDLDDGTIEIDAQRRARKEGYLFAGSNRGGERAGAIYSLLGPAKLNGINPERFLRHVLTHIGDHPINRIAELLPRNVPSTHTAGVTTHA